MNKHQAFGSGYGSLPNADALRATGRTSFPQSIRFNDLIALCALQIKVIALRF
jgi:hypothetical protein